MKRRTQFLLLAALLSIGTLVFGLVTSGAWFTDSYTSGGSILTSGSLDLHVTGGPLRATNLKPDKHFTPLGVFCGRNTGTTPLKYRGRFESTQPLSNDLLKYITMKVEQHTTGPWKTVRVIEGRPANETEGLPYYFKFPGQGPDAAIHDIVQGSLDRNEKVCYRLSVMLEADTPDSEQGKSIYFVLHLKATQANNPSWH